MHSCRSIDRGILAVLVDQQLRGSVDVEVGVMPKRYTLWPRGLLADSHLPIHRASGTFPGLPGCPSAWERKLRQGEL
jgi:hypothetical protein